MKKLLIPAVLVCSAFALTVTRIAAAGDTPCVGALTGTFDNVVVPGGATCILSNSLVHGSVKALEGSRLFMRDDTVRGNVEGDKALSVQILRSLLLGNVHISEAGDPTFVSAAVLRSVLTGGDIQIERGRFPLGDWRVEDNVLRKGNIEVEENDSTFNSRVRDSDVAGNVQVFKNLGTGAKVVRGNTVGGNLQCKENTPPFIGRPNVVTGNAEDQCAMQVEEEEEEEEEEEQEFPLLK